ncbi:MAG: DUF3820 family protein [Deltaproteobacteria bacterium]|nr:DUF3820 family protein [Deltaproteobacteria bacterium]
MDTAPDPRRFLALATTRMPFGKYQGRLLVDLPEPYVVWYHRAGYPAGDMNGLLRELYEVKVNGLEPLLDRFKPR